MLTAGPRARLRPAQPGRPADRAWRSVHDRLRDLGRADLPRRLRRRVRRGAAGADRRLRRAAGRAVLRRHRRVVRRDPHRPDRRAMHEIVGATSVTRSSASSSTPGTSSTSTNGSTRRSPPGSTIELRSGMAFQVDVIPGHRDRVLHDEHRGRHRPGRRAAAGQARRSVPGGVAPDRAAARLHGRRRSGSSSTRTSCRSPTCPRSCRRSCCTRSRDVAGRMTRPRELVLEQRGAPTSASTSSPSTGAHASHTSPRLGPACGRPTRPGTHATEPFRWGAYGMAPWCNRAVPGHGGPVAGRDGRARGELPRRDAPSTGWSPPPPVGAALGTARSGHRGRATAGHGPSRSDGAGHGGGSITSNTRWQSIRRADARRASGSTRGSRAPWSSACRPPRCTRPTAAHPPSRSRCTTTSTSGTAGPPPLPGWT